MTSKLINYLNKVFFKYIALIFLSFFLTIFFMKEKKHLFINTSYLNHNKEVKKLLKKYISLKKDTPKEKQKSRELSLKIKQKGSFAYPILFSQIKEDYSHKVEYLNLLKDINFSNPTCPDYDIDCNLLTWDKIKHKYTPQFIEKKLKDWKLNKKSRKIIEKEIEDLGTYSLSYLLLFVNKNKEFSYKELKPFYLQLNKIKGKALFEQEYFDKKQKIIIEYFRHFYIENLYYYSEFTISNRLKCYFLDTKFFKWAYSCFLLSFGALEKQTVLKFYSLYFIKTFIIFISSIFVAYYFSLMSLLIVKRKKTLVYRFFNQLLHIISTFPPVILILAFIGVTYFMNFSQKYKLIIYICVILFTSFILIFKNIESILVKESKSENIKALQFFGIKEHTVFNKYIFKSVNIFVLKKIKTLLLPIITYIIIFEYFIDFDGIAGNFLKLIETKNHELLRVNILFLGLIVIFSEIITDFMIFLNLKETRKNERNF